MPLICRRILSIHLMKILHSY